MGALGYPADNTLGARIHSLPPLDRSRRARYIEICASMNSACPYVQPNSREVCRVARRLGENAFANSKGAKVGGNRDYAKCARIRL